MAKQIIFSIAVLTTSFVLLIPGTYQQREVVKKDGDNVTERVKVLERRVAQLESVVFSTAKLSVLRAERQLSESQTRLQNSKRLFTKGFITKAQLQQDEFDVRQAQQELKLAQTEQGQKKLVSDLEILEAKQRLSNAEEQLEHIQRLAQRNFATLTDVENAKRSVDMARKSLDNAQLKLKAAKQLESISDK